MQDLGHVQLKKRSNNERSAIRIVQLTDLHQWPRGVKEFEARGRIIDFDKEGYSSERNVELVAHVVKRAQPDLVVLTGDILDGRPCANMESTKFLEVFKDVIQPLMENNIPWTFCPGNHDDDFKFQDGPWTRQDMLKIYSLPGCISAKATSFDHTLTVSRNASADPSALRLWLFDSGMNSPDPKIRYTTFSPEAVQGYIDLSKSQGFNSGAVGLVYAHIPLPQMEGMQPLAGKNGLFDAGLAGGVVPFPFNYRPFSSLVRLLGKDLVAGCSRLESGIFDAFNEQGNVLAYFCGHDHHSDWVGKRDNVYLCYGRCGGHTPPHDWEGAGGSLPFAHGARVVQVLGDQANTWVCTFENDVEDEFTFVKQ